MRVAIDASAIGSVRGGDDSYVRGLLAGLAQIVPDGGEDVFPLLLRPGIPPLPVVAGRAAFPIRRIPWGPRVMRHAAAIPFLAWRERQRLDLLHSVIHAPPLSPAPGALYLPDIAFRRHPSFYPLSTRLRLNLLVPLHIRQARVILTLSEYSRRDLIDAYRLAPERVFVVPCNVLENPSRDEAPQPPIRLPPGQADGPFFLYLGNLHPRKNVPRLIEAFVRARRSNASMERYGLVVAGGRWFAGGEEERAAREAPPGSVALLGRVSEDMRDRLLRAAHALVYPSLFEGFGLPPVEAMAVGTPVLASNTSAMPEVLGDAALLVDPLNTDAIAAGLVQLATDEALRASLVKRGFLRAALYTPRATGRAALQAFRWAIEHR